MKKSLSMLYMGTFPPRECGIATFTRDLSRAIDKKSPPLIKGKILALNRNSTEIYNYPKKVIFQIEDNDIQEYVEVAKKINNTDSIKLISIQHEFGIFGGNYGDYLIPFLEIIDKPVIITFHSIVPSPDKRLKKVVQSIAEKTACITVMTEKGVAILRKDYNIKTDIVVIPHGIPTISLTPSIKAKAKMDYKDKILLSSFGLLSKGKGYEYVIDALPEVIKKFPNVLYLIIGETHPVVRKNEGEKYRVFLEKKVKKLGLQKNVKFYNKYLKLREIIKYLKATDIYISPSLDPRQITSGTLAYAVGAGKAVISTPFLHAKDMIHSKRGILLTKFKDSKAFAKSIIKILSNPELKESMEKNAYSYSRHMTWPNVALSYLKVFNKYTSIPKSEKNLPKVNLRHLARMTDEFGMIQFANQIKPDVNSGYTLDDNARAMIVCSMHYNIFRNSSKLKLINTYLDFIKYVLQSDGKLYNFVDYNKKINLEHWSEDAHGRALWSLGCLISLKSIPLKLRNEAEQIFNNALNTAKNIKSPRAVAFTIIGLYSYNKAKPSSKNISKIRRLASYLVSLYEKYSSDGWRWFEEYMTYSNSKLPEALFYAYLATKNKKYLETAESTLKFLSSITFENGIFAPIGHNGWYFKNGKKAYFDQQPVDTASMVQTLSLASQITKKEKYKKDAFTAFNWFLGKNYLNQVVYDEFTGGCHDGVGEFSVNLNQGAESTISYLIARLTLFKLK